MAHMESSVNEGCPSKTQSATQSTYVQLDNSYDHPGPPETTPLSFLPCLRRTSWMEEIFQNFLYRIPQELQHYGGPKWCKISEALKPKTANPKSPKTLRPRTLHARLLSPQAPSPNRIRVEDLGCRVLGFG